MSSKIVIFGITGNQGSSVANALLEHSEQFEVVGITRNLTSPACKVLEKAGAKLVKGDLDDPTTYDAALKDADGVFLVTDYWSHFTGTNEAAATAAEVEQGKAAVDAVKREGVKHLVFSTLEALPGSKIGFCDGKAAITAYIHELGVPATQLYTTGYYSNIFVNSTETDGVLTIHHPVPDNVPIPSYAVEQTGLWARLAFSDPEAWIGKDMYAAAENVTPAEMAKDLAALTGKTVVTRQATEQDFKANPPMWRYYQELRSGGLVRDFVASRELVPEAWSFKEWAEKSAAAHLRFGF